ncbi:TPA: phenylalanine--tRNA ligase subunit alpha [Candidatus Poribacteria bacterium]|nr:phenylalanine--tRNA ligase subunit alpha [Candidatus Poribacteria bacterium]
MQEKLKTIESEALEQLALAKSLAELDNIRVKYLGKKGVLTDILKGMKDVPPEERPIIGQLANKIKDTLSTELDKAIEAMKVKEYSAKLASEFIDITLPGRRHITGKKHPLTQITEEIVEIFKGMGFQVADGPEVEIDYYNFDALNMPEHHPARDERDSMYIKDGVLLRTETSAVQIRVMERQKPPVRVIVPGKVYRRDDDLRHSPMFQQVEGLMVDEHIRFSDLKGVLVSFIQQMFGKGTKYRFMPDFFPFTEPSAQVHIGCAVCKGSGCKTCSNTGWLEILGSGSVDPEVFKAVGYDPEKYTGFAFGMGIERVAMLIYGIDNIRLFFENDLRFLQQF